MACSALYCIVDMLLSVALSCFILL